MTTYPPHVMSAVRSIPHPRQEPTVTAPRLSPAGLSPLLDQLDEARAKGTVGPWVVDDEYPGVVAAPRTAGVDVADCFEGAGDAALIVAAVNALPELVRLAREREALRQAVETVAAWCEKQAASRSHFAKVDPAYRNTVIPYEATAERLRDALTAALTPGADTAGATA